MFLVNIKCAIPFNFCDLCQSLGRRLYKIQNEEGIVADITTLLDQIWSTGKQRNDAKILIADYSFNFKNVLVWGIGLLREEDTKLKEERRLMKRARPVKPISDLGAKTHRRSAVAAKSNIETETKQ